MCKGHSIKLYHCWIHQTEIHYYYRKNRRRGRALRKRRDDLEHSENVTSSNKSINKP